MSNPEPSQDSQAMKASDGPRPVNPTRRAPPPSAKRNRSPELRAILEPIVLSGETIRPQELVRLVNTELTLFEHLARPFSELTDDEKRALMTHELGLCLGAVLKPGRPVLLEPGQKEFFDKTANEIRARPLEHYPVLLAAAESAYDSVDSLRVRVSGRKRAYGALAERERWLRRLKQLRKDLGPNYLVARERRVWAWCYRVLRGKMREIKRHPSPSPTDFWGVEDGD